MSRDSMQTDRRKHLQSLSSLSPLSSLTTIYVQCAVCGVASLTVTSHISFITILAAVALTLSSVMENPSSLVACNKHAFILPSRDINLSKEQQ